MPQQTADKEREGGGCVESFFWGKVVWARREGRSEEVRGGEFEFCSWLLFLERERAERGREEGERREGV